MIGFVIGFLLAGGAGWFLWWSSRREAVRLDEEKQRLAQEKLIVVDFMHVMAEAIGAGMDRDELFRRVLRTSILSTGAQSACVFERENDRLRGVAVQGLFPPHRPLPESVRERISTRAKFLEQILRSETFEVGEGLVGAVAQGGEGLLISDARADPRVVKHEDPALKVRSVIVVPISFRERNIGVLAIVNPGDSGSFSDTDFSLAKSLAEQAALAIHNLDLMAMQIEKSRLDVDLSIAREIQSTLLPRDFPKDPLLDISALYRPAQKVGGDLYDVFRLGPHRYGVAVADVSGKGVAASLVMAICQTHLRHLARSFESPARVLTELNRLMDMEIRQEMFVTMVYAVIDMESGHIRFARAGHEKPLLMRRGEGLERAQVDFLTSEGMALGLVPSDFFSQTINDCTVNFRAGDIFVLYTDGITEAANAEETEFSNGRLADAVRELRESGAATINENLLDRVSFFSGSPFLNDDITLVTIKHLASSSSVARSSG
jgi:sigma-B regulation protein RsbU (phosphoserine phosphatase)